MMGYPQTYEQALAHADARIVAQRHREEGAAEERTKIVAWLRKRDGFEDCYSELKDQWLSDRITRGEHLK